MAANTARKYIITGRVQGVGYRFFAEDWANRLGIRGYVKNCWDGSVEVYAIADESTLEEFKTQLAEGPLSARVNQIDESEAPISKAYHRFEIEPTG